MTTFEHENYLYFKSFDPFDYNCYSDIFRLDIEYYHSDQSHFRIEELISRTFIHIYEFQQLLSQFF